MNTFNIRPYQMEDIDAVYAAADELRVIISKWMGWMTPEYSREDTAMGGEQAVAAWDWEEVYEHLIIGPADGSIVGACGLNLVKRTNGSAIWATGSGRPESARARRAKRLCCSAISG